MLHVTARFVLTMTHLLIHVPDNDPAASTETKFGGRPSAPAGELSWPVCKSCDGHMQFLGQLRVDYSDELLLLFMCQNDPGGCSEWDPDEGANAVVVPAVGLALVEPPAEGDVVRPTRHGAATATVAGDDYEEARVAWASGHGVSPRQVLGQLGGAPSWLQGEEVPNCDGCEQPMPFAAQLEQGPDWKTEMNFGGGGSAYVFRCACAKGGAKMLWQC